MTIFTLRDPDSGISQEIQAASPEEAREEAREWAREGDWGAEHGTIWVTVLIEDPDGGTDSVMVQIDPAEPPCPEGDHDWQSPHEIVGGIRENPGVWGHGGGVLVVEACARCGAQRVTDTWAQDPTTGQEGLRSVRYSPPGFYRTGREGGS